MYLLKMLAIQLHIHTFYSFNIISNLLTLSAELYPLHSDVMENILNILLSYPNNIYFDFSEFSSGRWRVCLRRLANMFTLAL